MRVDHVVENDGYLPVDIVLGKSCPNLGGLGAHGHGYFRAGTVVLYACIRDELLVSFTLQGCLSVKGCLDGHEFVLVVVERFH